MELTGSVGIGTSAYLTATSLIWIGGMCCLASAPYSLTLTSMVNGRCRIISAMCG
jgi:hypothetical protein